MRREPKDAGSFLALAAVAVVLAIIAALAAASSGCGAQALRAPALSIAEDSLTLAEGVANVASASTEDKAKLAELGRRIGSNAGKLAEAAK